MRASEPLTGAPSRPPGGVRYWPSSGEAGSVASAMSSGSGSAASGGGATGVPWPGWVAMSEALEIRFASLTIGISSSWLSRTSRSGPRPFHEASAVTETP